MVKELGMLAKIFKFFIMALNNIIIFTWPKRNMIDKNLNISICDHSPCPN